MEVSVSQSWDDVEAILARRGLVLPRISAPTSVHLPYRRSGSLVMLSGILPVQPDGTVLRGTFGGDLGDGDREVHGQTLALTLIATMKAHFGSPEEVTVLEVLVFVRSTADYTSHHRVADSFSSLVVDVLGARAQHARTTIGVPALALGASLEARCQLEATVQ